VRVDLEEPVPPVRVPAARVGMILRNLVSNAIKYSDPKADLRWVRISFVQGASGGWTIAISDNGLGIPREQHARVFQRFLRLHPERADGTGLGLAIALETAVRMKGGIDFDSEPGVGSTFRFTLPGPAAAS
jgi:signal transduction histidine kinase